MMMHQKAATQEAIARTRVIWDIKSCPVPSGCDARRVGPCIKLALENLGYSGPLTITAIGHLLDVHEDVLRSISSTGISLDHIPLDVVSILDAMIKWGNDDPANILLITARDFSDGLEYLQRKGFNIIRQILYDDSLEAFPTSDTVESLWKNFLTDTMDTEEKFGETSEYVWSCRVCRDVAYNDFSGKGFENFTYHLWSLEHRERMLMLLPNDYKLRKVDDDEEVEGSLDSHPRNTTTILNREPMRMAETKEEAEARTWVMWEIGSCPVPSECDACCVGPCIKRAFENLGYSGPLTITAIGDLLDVPLDVLRSISSTGISLHHTPLDVNFLDPLFKLGNANQPPANILLITARDFYYGLVILQRKGFNILWRILYNDSPEVFRTSTETKSLWKSFLTDTMGSVEKSSETSECVWTCAVCVNDACNDLDGKGSEDLTKHLRSLEHRKKMLRWLPFDYNLKREEDKEEVETARRNLRQFLEMKRKNPEWKEMDNMPLGELLFF